MRSRWFPDNFVALCAYNFARFCRFCFGPTALLDEFRFSPRFVFFHNDYRLQNRPTTNTADTQQNGERVDYSGTRERARPKEKVGCKMIG